jgi:hypothetical protein
MDKQNLKGSDDGVQHSETLGFLDFVHRPELFPSVDEVMETPTLLGPLQTANLNHRSSFRNKVFSSIVFWIPDDGQAFSTCLHQEMPAKCSLWENIPSEGLRTDWRKILCVILE